MKIFNWVPQHSIINKKVCNILKENNITGFIIKDIDVVGCYDADIANKDEYILGDVYGYIKCISIEGKNKWTSYIGWSISSIDLSKDDSKLLVGTYAGILHLLELHSNNKDSYDIGNGNIHSIKTWLLCNSQKEFMKW